ncbi:hypothetical protein JXB01_02530 [Candidatus Micrarchaeota archaeon]|nr:hypothetical protein [Candidatus Micrarchaeota archaeon]
MPKKSKNVKSTRRISESPKVVSLWARFNPANFGRVHSITFQDKFGQKEKVFVRAEKGESAINIYKAVPGTVVETYSTPLGQSILWVKEYKGKINVENGQAYFQKGSKKGLPYIMEDGKRRYTGLSEMFLQGSTKQTFKDDTDKTRDFSQVKAKIYEFNSEKKSGGGCSGEGKIAEIKTSSFKIDFSDYDSLEGIKDVETAVERIADVFVLYALPKHRMRDLIHLEKSASKQAESSNGRMLFSGENKSEPEPKDDKKAKIIFDAGFSSNNSRRNPRNYIVPKFRDAEPSEPESANKPISQPKINSNGEKETILGKIKSEIKASPKNVAPEKAKKYKPDIQEKSKEIPVLFRDRQLRAAYKAVKKSASNHKEDGKKETKPEKKKRKKKPGKPIGKTGKIILKNSRIQHFRNELFKSLQNPEFQRFYMKARAQLRYLSLKSKQLFAVLKNTFREFINAKLQLKKIEFLPVLNKIEQVQMLKQKIDFLKKEISFKLEELYSAVRKMEIFILRILIKTGIFVRKRKKTSRLHLLMLILKSLFSSGNVYKV